MCQLSHLRSGFGSVQGCGVYPSVDPFGRPFSRDYEPKRFAKAGTLIAGGYRGVLEGILADQEFVKQLFGLTRFLQSLM